MLVVEVSSELIVVAVVDSTTGKPVVAAGRLAVAEESFGIAVSATYSLVNVRLIVVELDVELVVELVDGLIDGQFIAARLGRQHLLELDEFP